MNAATRRGEEDYERDSHRAASRRLAEGEPLFVERPPDDGAREPGLARGADVGRGGHAAARDDPGARALERDARPPGRARRACRRGSHRCRSRSSMPSRTTRSRQLFGAVVDVSVQPRIATMPSRASIPTASRSVGADAHRCRHERGIDRRGGPYYGPGDAEFQPLPEPVERAKCRPRAGRRRGPPPGGGGLGSRRRCALLRGRGPDPPHGSTARPGRRIAPRRAEGSSP